METGELGGVAENARRRSNSHVENGVRMGKMMLELHERFEHHFGEGDDAGAAV